MTDLIHAYTKPGITYPGFVNASIDDDGTVVLMVRSDPKEVGGIHVCGMTATLRLTKEEWNAVKAGLALAP